MGVDLDEDALGGVDVDLEQPGFVEGRVEQREQTLGTKASASASTSPIVKVFRAIESNAMAALESSRAPGKATCEENTPGV